MSWRPDQAVSQRVGCAQTLLAEQQHLRALMQARLPRQAEVYKSPGCSGLRSLTPGKMARHAACCRGRPAWEGPSTPLRPRLPRRTPCCLERWHNSPKGNQQRSGPTRTDCHPALLPQHAHRRRTPRLAQGPRRRRTAAALGNQPPADGKPERGQVPGGAAPAAAALLLERRCGGRADELGAETSRGGGLPPPSGNQATGVLSTQGVGGVQSSNFRLPQVQKKILPGLPSTAQTTPWTAATSSLRVAV